MTKALASKSLIIRLNLIFLTFVLIFYATFLLKPPSLYSKTGELIRKCQFQDCMKKNEDGIKKEAAMEENRFEEKRKIEGGFLGRLRRGKRIGLVNLKEEDIKQWEKAGEISIIRFRSVSRNLEWKHLFPEWIDEEEEHHVPSCPEIPMPDFGSYGKFDKVVLRLPCSYPEEGWRRDISRLQIHLIAAYLAVKNNNRGTGMRLLFLSSCRPMLELFRCQDLVNHDGNTWLYQPDLERLEKIISLPIGSCKLSLPLWSQGNEVSDLSEMNRQAEEMRVKRREAYATVLHSSEAYVCGAIMLAHSIIKTGSKRDLVILIDKSISEPKRQALAGAGWKIHEITRIRNPKAEKNSYNEYNYSKLRLWQLTYYDKIIFIDADILVLRNMDLLFQFPQISATGNDKEIFNSGVMVIEPSNCTFGLLKKMTTEVVSYNGGDQGFLNEIFVWWHRLPRRVNFLKNFWSNTSMEVMVKNQLFGAEPPKLFAIHYLGIKPWLCYRDYDCNWNVPDQHVYASDVAHSRWWKIHDSLSSNLQSFCLLSQKRKETLDWQKKKARELRLDDEHWKLNVTDPRKKL